MTDVIKVLHILLGLVGKRVQPLLLHQTAEADVRVRIRGEVLCICEVFFAENAHRGCLTLSAECTRHVHLYGGLAVSHRFRVHELFLCTFL